MDSRFRGNDQKWGGGLVGRLEESSTHCHACEGRHPLAVSDPMPSRYEGPKVIGALSPHLVMPAQAGIHWPSVILWLRDLWIPASAGMTRSGAVYKAIPNHWGCVKNHFFC